MEVRPTSLTEARRVTTSPTNTGSMKAISSSDAVTTGPPACFMAASPAALSTSFMITPPWMLPRRLASSWVICWTSMTSECATVRGSRASGSAASSDSTDAMLDEGGLTAPPADLADLDGRRELVLDLLGVGDHEQLVEAAGQAAHGPHEQVLALDVQGRQDLVQDQHPQVGAGHPGQVRGDGHAEGQVGQVGLRSGEPFDGVVGLAVGDLDGEGLVVDAEVVVLVVGEVPEQRLGLPGQLRPDPGHQVVPEPVQEHARAFQIPGLGSEVPRPALGLPGLLQAARQ